MEVGMPTKIVVSSMEPEFYNYRLLSVSELRALIKTCGKRMEQIAVEAGVSYSVVSRIAAVVKLGKGGMSMRHMACLTQYFVHNFPELIVNVEGLTTNYQSIPGAGSKLDAIGWKKADKSWMEKN